MLALLLPIPDWVITSLTVPPCRVVALAVQNVLPAPSPGKLTFSSRPDDDWLVHLVDTGPATNTGGRIKRVASLLGARTFLVTYGDGVCDVDPHRVLALHRKKGAIATLTAVRPAARFGRIDFDGDTVKGFAEKPQAGEGWINGGFLACEPGLLDLIDGDPSSLESDALERASTQGKLCAYRHEGFWQCMDTLRDKRQLEAIWESGKVPWKTWA